MDDCPDYQEGKKETEPEHPHWFHSNAANAEKKPHFCCKLDSTSWSNHVGVSADNLAQSLCFVSPEEIPSFWCVNPLLLKLLGVMTSLEMRDLVPLDTLTTLGQAALLFLDASSANQGFKYHRQANLTLCTYETRKVPQEACCRVGKLDNVGLRVKDVEMVLYLGVVIT